MPTDYTVSTRFRADDKVSKSFRDMDKGAKRFGRSATKSFRDASRSASRFRDVTKGILAAGVVQRGVTGLTTAMRGLTTQFIDFDQATIGAAARFKDIGPNAVDFEQQLKKIRDRAREAGATTEFTAAQSADALDFLARAGFTSVEAFGALNSMINLATASGEDFATVADMSSDLLGAFGLNVSDAAQKVKNLARLNDVLVKAANSANVTIEDMFETMKMAGPIATGMGQSLESVTAITAVLGGTGIKGSQGATVLKNAILNLTAPSSKAIKMIKALGVAVEDGDKNMRPLNDIIGDLGPKLKKMGNIKSGKIFDAIFGRRAIAGAINIANATDTIVDLQKALEDADGTAQATADRLRQSLGNRLKALGSAASEFGFKIIEAFEVKGEGAIDKLTNAIRKFDPEPIIFGIGMAVDIFKTLWDILKPFAPFLPWFIGMWVAFGVVAKALAFAQLITGLAGLAAGALASGGAMGLLNAVMIANPVGLIVVGIAALIAIIVLLIKNFDKVKAAWGDMVSFMKDSFGIMAKFVRGIMVGLAGVIMGFLIPMQKAFQFFGKDSVAIDEALDTLSAFQADVKTKIEGRTPPNQEEAAARRGIDFKGEFTFSNAPPGSTVEGETTGAPPISMLLLD